VKISQNFVAFSEYMNFTYLPFPGLEPREAAKQLIMEYLNGDMKYLTEQKPGETIFDCVTEHIDFLKPSTQEKRIKEACNKCGTKSTVTTQNIRVSYILFCIKLKKLVKNFLVMFADF